MMFDYVSLYLIMSAFQLDFPEVLEWDHKCFKLAGLHVGPQNTYISNVLQKRDIIGSPPERISILSLPNINGSFQIMNH